MKCQDHLPMSARWLVTTIDLCRSGILTVKLQSAESTPYQRGNRGARILSRHCQPCVVMMYAVVLARNVYSEVHSVSGNVFFLVCYNFNDKTEVVKTCCVVVVTWFEPAFPIVYTYCRVHRLFSLPTGAQIIIQLNVWKTFI